MLANLTQWIATIVVTAIVGATIAFFFQKRGWIFQQRIKQATDKHESQLSLTREIFGLIDKRIYASRIYLDELISNEPPRIDAARKEYQPVVREWNEKAQGLIIGTKIRFGPRIAYDLDAYFMGAFSEVDRKLRLKRIGQSAYLTPAELTIYIRRDLDLINATARDYMERMYRANRETLSIIEDSPTISLERLSEISLFYIIKHLFVRRVQPY